MSIDKNTNEGKNYRNNVVKSTPGTSKSRINTGFPENISVLSPMMQEYCKTKEEYKDCLKIQIPFGRRAEILLADDYLTPDEKIIFEDGIDPAIKSELFKEVLQAKTDKVFKSFLLEIFGKQPVLNENLSITTTKSGDKQYIIINFQGALPY